MRKKLTQLETEILAQSDELAFRDHGFDAKPHAEEDSIRLSRHQQGEWKSLLERTFADGRWIVGISIASYVSVGLWWQYFILRDYKASEDAVKRLIAHPDSASAERHYKADWPLMLFIAQWAQGDQDDSLAQIAAHIQSGLYRPGTMAKQAFYLLDIALSAKPLESPINDAMREVGRAIAEAKRASQKRMRACAESKTIGEWIAAVDFWPLSH